MDNVTAIAFINKMGGPTLTGTIGLSSGNMELVSAKRHSNPCRVSPWEGEYRGRLGVTTCGRLQQLETTPRDISSVGRETRPLFSRPLCIKNKRPTPQILQLESGPHSLGSGRSLYWPLSISILPVFPDLTERASWRGSTHSVAEKLWDCWCTRRGIDPLSAPVSEILEFLLEQFETGKQYRTINTNQVSYLNVDIRILLCMRCGGCCLDLFKDFWTMKISPFNYYLTRWHANGFS